MGRFSFIAYVLSLRGTKQSPGGKRAMQGLRLLRTSQ